MHKLKMIILLMILGLNTTQVFSWNGMSTPALHVEGRFLKDPSGNNVVLRGGWMQPTETWFNGGGRWYSNPTDWTKPTNVAGMLNYLNGAATLMSDTSPKYGTNHGWYTTFVRVNTDAIGGWTQASGLVDQAQFNGWIQNFLVPYANHLKSRGLYLVLCATGPINTPNNGSHNAGVTEGKRLRTFWTTVANAPGVKNADNIMFELMNEPVDIESSPGNGDWGNGQAKYYQAFRNWIQPVINDIRSTGANNVIWVPTLEWQGSPRQHAQYPFTGTNCGVAVHYYPPYGGCNDNVSCHNNLWNSNYKLAADIWPMIITENFWFPEDTGLDKGSTANYGNTLRANMTKEGNVSYMIGFLSDLLDDLTKALPANCNLSSKQGAQAAFEWFYQENSCTPTAITSYVKVNNGAWTSSTSITVNVGDTLTVGPHPETGGSWSWTGPNSFSSTTREIVLTSIQSNRAGIYTANYTNTGGCKSTATFTVTVKSPCTPTAIIPYVNVNGGAWTSSTSVAVTAGGSVTFGPQPLTGGSWSWSGPNAFTASTRELLFNNVQSSQSGSYVATFTNTAGCKSSNIFTLNIGTPNTAPTVSISSPISGTSFTAPANIVITASAADADGIINSVQFYNGTTLLGTDVTAPYSFTWSNVVGGTYSITAKATDNNSAVTTSAAVSVTVTSAPPLTGDFTGPECGAPNGIITLELNANLRASATNYSWWFQGYNQSMTPVAGSPYKVNIATGPYFTGGQMCVGVNYSVAPYYASYCKTISLCAPSLMAAPAVVPASIAPNPSAGVITLTISEDVTSYKLVDDQGQVSYSGGSLSSGESKTFGEQLRSGQYVLVIQYASGRIETLKVLKI